MNIGMASVFLVCCVDVLHWVNVFPEVFFVALVHVIQQYFSPVFTVPAAGIRSVKTTT